MIVATKIVAKAKFHGESGRKSIRESEKIIIPTLTVYRGYESRKKCLAEI